MKRAVGLATAALFVVAGTQLIANVNATRSLSVPRRGAMLEMKVKRFQGAVAVLAATRRCLGAAAVSVYGDPTATPPNGYYFTNDGTTSFLTSAIDVTEQGQQPDGYFATVSANCVGAAKASHSYRQTELRRAFR